MKKTVILFCLLLIGFILYGCDQKSQSLNDLANTRWELLSSENENEYTFNDNGTEIYSVSHQLVIYKIYNNKYRKVMFTTEGIQYDIATSVKISIDNDTMIITEVCDENEKELVFRKVG